ncbi:hypothetical protein FO522_30925, partial [Bacillus nitratireducens]|nr:hypothetical protein [Bacillus nitratireducens]
SSPPRMIKLGFLGMGFTYKPKSIQLYEILIFVDRVLPITTLNPCIRLKDWYLCLISSLRMSWMLMTIGHSSYLLRGSSAY